MSLVLSIVVLYLASFVLKEILESAASRPTSVTPVCRLKYTNVVVLITFAYSGAIFIYFSHLVLGANGRTGLEVVRQGLERNYRVTAFVRDDKLLLEDTTLRKNQNLLIVRGSPTSQADLDRCVEGQDVVVNVIGVCLCV